MDLSEALPLLTENHTAVVSTVTPSGVPQNTIVTTGFVDGKLVWVSRGRTVKIKNIERTGRATATVIRLDNRRYVTVEGPAAVRTWQNTEASVLVRLLWSAYEAMERPPQTSREEFAKTMEEEQRMVVEITPQRLYGSLTVR